MLTLPAMSSLLVCVTLVKKVQVFCKLTGSYVSSAQSRLYLCPAMRLGCTSHAHSVLSFDIVASVIWEHMHTNAHHNARPSLLVTGSIVCNT